VQTLIARAISRLLLTYLFALFAAFLVLSFLARKAVPVMLDMFRVVGVLVVATSTVGLAYAFAACSSEDAPPAPIVDAQPPASRPVRGEPRATSIPEEAAPTETVACQPPFCPPVPGMGSGRTQIR